MLAIGNDKEGIAKAEAEEIKKKLEDAGNVYELQRERNADGRYYHRIKKVL